MKKIILVAAIILTTGITALTVGAKRPAKVSVAETEKSVDFSKSNTVKADISSAD